MEQQTVRVGLLGAGSVGAQVAHRLLHHSDEYAARIGAGIELVGVAVRDQGAQRDTDIPKHLLTTGAQSLIRKSDIVIELIGGIEPARSFIQEAFQNGAEVVTANKALLAHHGTELFDAAKRFGAQLYYEAAVGGAIPIIRPLRESLAGDTIRRIIGIVSGTTNFILDRMDAYGESFQEALTLARRFGYVESDPAADIEGYDAAQKAAILASLAFHTPVSVDEVHREGIASISHDDIVSAHARGCVIKLVTICERLDHAETKQQGISVRAYPALIDRAHPLAAVRGGHNAVFVEAECAGDLMFYGAGAGGIQTASAVLGDLISAARRHIAGGPGLIEPAYARLPVLANGYFVTKYHIILEVDDKPGVLAEIAHVLSEGGVSVETMHQSVPLKDAEGFSLPTAVLEIGTHSATEFALSSMVESLRLNPCVQRVISVFRAEGSVDEPN